MMVFAGAFVGLPESPETHDFLKFGMIPEFMGRISAVANLNALTVEDIARIISEPKQSVLEHHQQLFRAQNSELQLTTVGARAIAEKAIALGTGARGLNRIISDMLTDAYFNLPEKPGKYTFGADGLEYTKPAAPQHRKSTTKAEIEMRLEKVLPQPPTEVEDPFEDEDQE